MSIRLYPHNDLEAEEVVRELCAQARLALGSGFDGVMVSEHHGGFGGYLAQPLQMTAFILEENSTGWVAAAPVLLPLRPTALVAEEVAWLSARHRGRVGIGVAAGALALDYAAAGIDPGEAVTRFKSELPRLVAMLRGEELGELAGDRALEACHRYPVPILSAAMSPAAARRAARCGAGILLEGMSDARQLARLTEAYDGAGGRGAKVLIRRVWLGPVRAELVEHQRAVYDAITPSAAAFGDDATVAALDPAEIAERLADVVTASGADSLNLRVHLPGVAPGEAREQIAALGASVIGALRAR